MESALRSLTKTAPFPQPPLLPLPAQAPSQQHSSWPSSRPAPPPRARKPAPNPKMAVPGASAPITVAAAPSRKRVAPATESQLEQTKTDSLYSVSPPPSCVPMPTSLLAVARKVPTACAVEVGGAGGTVDVGATDELRRLLRL